LGAVTQVLRCDLTRSFRLQAKGMLTRSKLKLPGLDFFLSSKRAGFEHTVDDFFELRRTCNVNVIDSAFITLDAVTCIIPIRFGLRWNGQLGHFLRRFVSDNVLSSALDVDDERVVLGGDVSFRVSRTVRFG